MLTESVQENHDIKESSNQQENQNENLEYFEDKLELLQDVVLKMNTNLIKPQEKVSYRNRLIEECK